MKLKLPHRDINLPLNNTASERIKHTNEILKEVIHFHEQDMTVEEYFTFTWDKRTTKVCLDILAYYITKEDKNYDTEVLSQRQMIEIQKGSKRHTTFSALPNEMQIEIGLVDVLEDDYDE